MKNPEIRFIDDNIDWENYNIKNSCKISTGHCVTDKDTSDDYEYPVISGGKEPMGYYLNFNRNANTITIARAGTAGFVNFLETPFWLNDKCFSVEPYSNDILPKFLYFVLKEMELKIMEMKGSSSVPTINTQHIGSINIKLPNLNIQKEIASLLSDIDQKIDNQESLIQKLKDTKSALLIKMFPQENQSIPEIRFAGFTFPWEQRKLGEVVNLQSGKDYKHLIAGDIPVYGTGGYMLSVNKALSYNQDAIGIGRKGTIDKPYILRAPFWTVDTLFFALPKEKYDLDFMYCVFQNINWKAKDESTGVPSLSKIVINDSEILLPSETEQKRIGTLFNKLDKTITLHQRKPFYLNFL